jgi:hypothetical protein
LVSTTAFVGVIAGPAEAVPVQWSVGVGGNGHYYDFVRDRGITWTDASAAASSSSFLSTPGHLTTITSAAENAFVFSSFNTPSSDFRLAWLGASQPAGELVAADNFTWVTGEPFVYTNWASGEPSDSLVPGAEQYLQMLGLGASGSMGVWNDDENAADPSTFLTGYLVEYPVPEPATAGLALLGLLCIAGRRS